jgi:hypothetical protein
MKVAKKINIFSVYDYTKKTKPRNMNKNYVVKLYLLAKINKSPLQLLQFI